MAGWRHYHTPGSVDEALALLMQYNGNARIVAGGTDLLLELQHGDREPIEALIDVTRIPELLGIIEVGTSEVRIGAAVTHTQIVGSDLLGRRATCLVESCGVVGGPQVRNVGTLGGNVAQALPAGDGTVSLVALDASAEVVRDGQHRQVAIGEMYRGPGKSLLDPTRDLLMGFHLKLCSPGEASAFERIMRPQGVALPVLGCAVWVRMRDTIIEEAHVCIAPVAPTPTRLEETEAALRGADVGDEDALALTLDKTCALVQREIDPRTSKYRATADYRVEVADVLMRSALAKAIERARIGIAHRRGAEDTEKIRK